MVFVFREDCIIGLTRGKTVMLVSTFQEVVSFNHLVTEAGQRLWTNNNPCDNSSYVNKQFDLKIENGLMV